MAQTLLKCSPALPQANPIGFISQCHSFGYQPAMAHGQPYSPYTLQPGSQALELWHGTHNTALSYMCKLSKAMQAHLPATHTSRAKLMAHLAIPTLKGTGNTCNTLVTFNYHTQPHYNNHNNPLGFTWAQFLKEHLKGCKRAAQSKSCHSTWAFVLPKYSLFMPIKDSHMIMWYSAHTMHSTILGTHKCRSWVRVRLGLRV